MPWLAAGALGASLLLLRRLRSDRGDLEKMPLAPGHAPILGCIAVAAVRSPASPLRMIWPPALPQRVVGGCGQLILSLGRQNVQSGLRGQCTQNVPSQSRALRMRSQLQACICGRGYGMAEGSSHCTAVPHGSVAFALMTSMRLRPIEQEQQGAEREAGQGASELGGHL